MSGLGHSSGRSVARGGTRAALAATLALALGVTVAAPAGAVQVPLASASVSSAAKLQREHEREQRRAQRLAEREAHRKQLRAEREERRERKRRERREARERGGGGPPPSRSLIIGTDDGAGWGAGPAKTLIGGGIDWTRDEVGQDSISASVKDGFKVLAIVGNTNDSTPLSKVEPKQWANEVVAELRANPGISIAEAGNEMYLKGNVAEPVQYGRMYLAAVNAMKAAGITTPLLFSSTGGYPSTGTWSAPGTWSLDSSGGGWLRTAVQGVPGLAAAILANGAAIHPYGGVGENNNDDYGVSAPAAEEQTAGAVLGSIPKFYVTEFGYSLSACGRDLGACSLAEQASKLKSAYAVFTADPHIYGIWWYQSHDDSTGEWGLMNKDNSTRPSFSALSTIAREWDE